MFVNVVSNIGIVFNESLLGNTGETNDPIVNIIERYKTHPSIRLIKEYTTQLDNRFSFELITYEDIHKEIEKLDSTKASQDTDIPSTIIKENTDIFANSFISVIIRHYLIVNSQQALKMPCFTNLLERFKVRREILPNLSKIYETIMHSQISEYFDKILSKYQFGFRQGYSSQQFLLVLIEKWKKRLDKGGKCGALLTDLSKAFDRLLHDLLIAKLHA